MNSSKKSQKNIIQNYQLIRVLFTYNIQTYFIAKSLQTQSIHTIAMIDYNQEIFENLRKCKQKIKELKYKKSFRNKVLCPSQILVEEHKQKKILMIVFDQKLLPIQHFIKEKLQFTTKQIFQMLRSGIYSLQELHINGWIHNNINPYTCYFSIQENNNLSEENGFEDNAGAKLTFNILDVIIEKFQKQKDQEKNLIRLIYQSENYFLGLKLKEKDDIQSFISVLMQVITTGKMLHKSRFQKEWKNEAGLKNWKLSDFFKEMIGSLSSDLQIISELYLITLEMQHGTKPEYIKLQKLIERKKVVYIEETQSINKTFVDSEWINKNDIFLQI